MILAVNTSRNMAAGVRLPIPLAAIVRASRSTSGRRALAALRGLGGLGESAFDASLRSYDIVGLLTSEARGPINSLAWNVEQGLATDPATLAANLLQEAQSMCSGRSWGLAFDRCEVPTAQIQQIVNNYAAAYDATVAQKVAQAAAGDVCMSPGFFADNPGIQLSQRAIEGCGYGYVPPAPTGGGNTTAYSTPQIAPAPTYPTTIQTQTPTGGGSASTVVNTPAQATLRNLSRPNLPLQVGDMFSLDVMGTPGGAVKITATKNGTPAGTAAYGNADGNGHRSITGTMTAAEVGSWVEAITVGDGGQPYTLSFNVQPAAVNPAGQSTNTGAGSGPTGGGSTTATNVSDTGQTDTTPPAPAPPATDGLTIGGVHLSTPMLLGVAAAALFFFSQGGRR